LTYSQDEDEVAKGIKIIGQVVRKIYQQGFVKG